MSSDPREPGPAAGGDEAAGDTSTWNAVGGGLDRPAAPPPEPAAAATPPPAPRRRDPPPRDELSPARPRGRKVSLWVWVPALVAVGFAIWLIVAYA